MAQTTVYSLSTKMIGDVLPSEQQNDAHKRSTRTGRSIRQAQESVYQFLLEIVKTWHPEDVLIEFKHLFLHHSDSFSADSCQAIYEILLSNNEEEFRNTLKRSCYILVNNWDASRNYRPIKDLIQLFEDPKISRQTISPTLRRSRQWLENFIASKDYQELKLFASRYDDRDSGPWSSRYTSYLLVPQYVDLKNPIEQREAARALSKQLKDRFKFDLAMYVARSQSSALKDVNKPRNPTALGDEVLRLIKAIVARRGPFSYINLANIFIQQVQTLNYREFKQSLQKYLIFSVDNKDFIDTLNKRITEKLETLYETHDDEPFSNALLLRTCNRVIEYLTTENQREPSPLFVLLLSQGNPITLVIVMLKIILICKHARTHLEARIAELIRYYQDYPEEDCQWMINFLEIFNVTFAIHAENVQYNLIRMEGENDKLLPIRSLDSYRVFSQLKRETSSTEVVDLEDDTLQSDTALP